MPNRLNTRVATARRNDMPLQVSTTEVNVA